jgi:hypothetical protein
VFLELSPFDGDIAQLPENLQLDTDRCPTSTGTPHHDQAVAVEQTKVTLTPNSQS